jgi:hypothetical protein
MRDEVLAREVRRALLSAALAVQLEGRAALKNHPDPVVGGLFEYTTFPGGFELRSKWQLDAGLLKPLVLTVGQRGNSGKVFLQYCSRRTASS